MIFIPNTTIIFDGERYKDWLLFALWETITVYAYHIKWIMVLMMLLTIISVPEIMIICVTFLSEGFGLSVECRGFYPPSLRILSSKSTRLIFHLKFRAFCISTQQNHSWKIQLGDQQYIFLPLPPTWIHSFCLSFALYLLFRSFPGSPTAVPSFVLSISPLISPHPFLLLWIIHSDNTLCKEAILYSHSVFLWSSSLGCTQL